MITYINLSSFAGGGKTTIAKLLIKTGRTFVIPKFTTRPRRKTEEEIQEYVYVSLEEFMFRRRMGHFLSVTKNGDFFHAIPHIGQWPAIPLGTELVLSLFGSEARLVQKYLLQMKLCFISFRDRSLLTERLRRRCEIDGSNFQEKFEKNERYFSIGIEGLYDFVVYNDTTPEECVKQIKKLIR